MHDTQHFVEKWAPHAKDMIKVILDKKQIVHAKRGTSIFIWKLHNEQESLLYGLENMGIKCISISTQRNSRVANHKGTWEGYAKQVDVDVDHRLYIIITDEEREEKDREEKRKRKEYFNILLGKQHNPLRLQK